MLRPKRKCTKLNKAARNNRPTFPDLVKNIFHLLVGVAILHGAAVAATSPPSKPAARQATNVILITMDTLRADHVGCYGASQVHTPTLDALCLHGIVFDRAFSQVPLTWPSHAAILTGTYPFQNGVQDFTGQPLSPQFQTVAEGFKRHRYVTGAVVSAFVLDRSWGLARGFDFYDDAFSAETFQKKDIGLVDRKAEESVTHAINWLTKTSHRPFFLWLHLYDPHSPYDPPEPYLTQYKGHLYDGEIAYADHELGRLMTWLKKNQLYDSSLIVFLSDHGESLGEHGETEHGFFIYNATIRIPLIVKPPAGSHLRAKRVNSPAETIAVAETLFQLAGVKDPIEKQFQAPSLLSNQEESAAYTETFYPFSSFGWSPLHSLETSRYQYIDAPTAELYDVIADSSEKNNLASQQPATAAVLKEKLQKLLARNRFTRQPPGAGNLSPDAREKLRALGYFGFRAAVSREALAAGLPDPKDKLWEFNTILKSQDAFQRNDDDQAEVLLRPVEERDPTIYVIPFMLGESALRRQNWRRAVEQLQRCLELNPNFDNAMTGLAHALLKVGRSEEARDWLQKALHNNPQNYRAWYEIGLMDMQTDPGAALSAFQTATSIQPNFPPGQRDLGLALFRDKKYSDAASHLEKALALGLDDAHIRNFLGICYSRTNHLQKSIASYKAALKLDPTLAEAHLNLAYELGRAGQRNRAQAEYAAACRLEATFCAAVPK
jgi:choline-sulfatase